MNVLIVDDEPLARARIARLLQKLRPDFNIVSLSENAEQALTACNEVVPDLAANAHSASVGRRYPSQLYGDIVSVHETEVVPESVHE